MTRALCLTLCLALAGCATTVERTPLRPLPEDSPPLPYAELLTRARLQATAATDAFYVNRWTDLEDAARGMEQTAKFLTKATDVPQKQKDTFQLTAADLGKEAVALREAARAKQADKVNESLQRIHLKVRELRLEN
jgi:hypothetical protein